MNSHYGSLTVDIDNLDGAPDEIDHITEIITSSLRSAGYKSTVTLDSHGSYADAQPEPTPAETPTVAATEPVKESTLRYAEEPGQDTP